MPVASVAAPGAAPARQATPQAQDTRSNQQNAAPTPLIPFIRASSEHTEPFFDTTVIPADFANGKRLPDGEVPADGYYRSTLVRVDLTGGAAGGTNAVVAPDGPWNILGDGAGGGASVQDQNGHAFFGPMDGRETYLVNKWGGSRFPRDPALSPIFAALDVNGNGTLVFRLPAEVTIRDALGAIANQNAASPYRIKWAINAAANVMSARPVTLPSVRVRAWLEAWAQPGAEDTFGAPQQVAPPAHGTVMYWTRQQYDLVAGPNKLKLTRVGNYVRNLILIWKDVNGVRQESQVPGSLQLIFDGQIRQDIDDGLLRHYMFERYGYANDAGVRVLDFTHEFDGVAGGELRDLYLATTQATRLEINGSVAATGQLVVLTNDIQVPDGESIFFTEASA